ncbi:MAG: ATP-binding protein [Thermomicrobiales bacterium]|nr:ATP-binding protein [Thermomicrobiales bacterium]
MTRRAHVVGDPSIDWYLSLAETPKAMPVLVAYAWSQAASPAITGNPGGAALIRQLTQSSLDHAGIDAEVSGASLPAEALENPNWPYAVRTYSFWTPVVRGPSGGDPVWRMSRFVGWHGAVDDDPAGAPVEYPARATSLFIEDAGQRFRADPRNWRQVADIEAAHILIRMTGNLGQGELWDTLLQHHADKLTLFCALSDLRREGAPIGRPLSWERTAQDVVAAVMANASLRAARRVVVMLATSGAVIVEKDHPSLVLFDPFHQEGDWERLRRGISYGAGSCAAASILHEMTANPEAPDLANAVRKGVTASRAMHEDGYEAKVVNGGWRLEFPVDRVSRIIGGDEITDSVMQVAEVQQNNGWRLFETAFAGSFRDAALQIALNGERAAGREIPIERMAAWTSVDRIEIESMRSVRNIINEYLETAKKQRPLNLAVFGPPGSGKSFAIKQMAKVTTSSGPPISVLEFNVSQFKDVEDVPQALHRVRDEAVSGSLPLVFWDEFDSVLDGREMGWLVNFLAPMQDGAFIDSGAFRPIGPAIFVFAGGTHATMDSFRARAMELPTAKATDFLSRLRGYVDILGPNPDGPLDQTYSLRRAMLLRAVLTSRAPQVFDGDRLKIDRGILRAFLDVPAYYHGSRSLESIVEMSALSGSLGFERAALPATHQIALHVDADAFMSLVDG